MFFFFFRVVIDMEDKMFLYNRLIFFFRVMKGVLGVIVDYKLLYL